MTETTKSPACPDCERDDGTQATHRPVNVLGMDLVEWKYKSCTAFFAVGDNWATIYNIDSSNPGKGHATVLLSQAKDFYTKQGKRFGGTVALSPAMKHLYRKLNIHEYN